MLWNKLKTKAIRMSKQWIHREISFLSLPKFYSPDLTNIVTVLISWARFGKKRRHTDKKLGKFKGQNPSLVRVRRSNDIFCDGFTSIHKGFQSKLTSCGEKKFRTGTTVCSAWIVWHVILEFRNSWMFL